MNTRAPILWDMVKIQRLDPGKKNHNDQSINRTDISCSEVTTAAPLKHFSDNYNKCSDRGDESVASLLPFGKIMAHRLT